MPLILGANSLAGGGYEIDNSLRFDEASGDYLSKASFGTPTSVRKSTISFWCKRSLIEEGIIFMNDTATFPIAKIYFDSSHRFSYIEFDPSVYIERTTNAVFRDVSAWYHIVVAIDTEQATADDRVKVYINGVQETSFATSTTPVQNTDLIINDNLRSAIGGSSTAGTDIFEGYIAEIIRVDGQQLAPSDFGEFDQDSGIWKPIAYEGTYGTNGFFLEFKDSSALGDDTSGNGNDFTVNNLTSIDQTTDTPTNNFATWNSLQPTSATLSNGNLTGQSTNGNYISGVSTLGVTKGKWYAEFKFDAESSAGEGTVGVTGLVRPTSAIIGQTGNFGLRNFNGLTYYTSGGAASSSTSQHDGFTTSDIIGVALDLDNDKLYFSKNGGWWDSASTWTGSTPTSYITLQTDIFDEFFFQCGDAGASVNATWSANFGNAPYTITTGNSDANGYGNFEYTVPSGYYALCTNNLAEYG